MEKYRINRLGEPQNKSGVSQKTGKPYNFNVIGLQLEGKEGWVDFNFNGDSHGLEAGKEYELVLTSREYKGKTYWSAAVPKKEDRMAAMGEETAKEINRVLNELTTIKIILHEILSYTKPKPKYKNPTAEEEGIDTSKTFPEDDFDDSTVPF